MKLRRKRFIVRKYLKSKEFQDIMTAVLEFKDDMAYKYRQNIISGKIKINKKKIFYKLRLTLKNLV